MIYVVSGIHRSGTTAAMEALIAGGITPFWSKRREQQMQLGQTDYVANPGSFWEVGQENYMRFGFSSELPDECCVKIQAIGLPILSAAKGYRICYMRRDPSAIRRSYEKAFPSDNFTKMYPTWPSHYWQLLDGVKAIMEARRDVDLVELWYDEVLENPETAMKKLAAHGFPIEVSKAAAVWDKKHRRHETF